MTEICKKESWLQNLSSDEWMGTVTKILENLLDVDTTSSQNDSINMDGFNVSDVISLLKRISPSCKDYLLYCEWGSKRVNCSDVRT